MPADIALPITGRAQRRAFLGLWILLVSPASPATTIARDHTHNLACYWVQVTPVHQPCVRNTATGVSQNVLLAIVVPRKIVVTALRHRTD